MEIKKQNGCVEIKTANGILKVYENPDSNYAGVYIDFAPSDCEGDIPLVSVENGVANGPSNIVAVRVWGDPWREDYTNRIDIPVSEIKKAILSEG